MSRGSAHRHVEPRIYQFPDGGTIRADQPIVEAERAIARAKSAARVDEARRYFESLQEQHLLEYGYDCPEVHA